MRMTGIFTPTGAIRAWATVLMLIVGFGLALGLTIGYVAQARRQDDERWCDLLDSLITPEPTSPPRSPQEARGRQITEQMRKLHSELGCDSKEKP